MKRISVMAVIFLCACASAGPPVPTKQGATQMQIQRDFGECIQQAQIATLMIVNPFEKVLANKELRDRCMTTRGYTVP
jgi:hypothetical protein